MNEEEFYQALKKANFTWRLHFNHQPESIRFLRCHKPKYACPICAVANYILGKNKYELQYDKAAIEIGLNQDLANDIMLAADGRQIEANHTQEIRKQLIEITQPT